MLGKTSRSRRASVVLPPEEQPEMPTTMALLHSMTDGGPEQRSLEKGGRRDRMFRETTYCSGDCGGCGFARLRRVAAG